MNTKKLAIMGMLIAISVALVAMIHFPIFPIVPFLEYDPADIPILITTCALGPVSGLILTVIASIIQGLTVSAANGIYGIIMHIIATSTYVLVTGLIYRKNKSRLRLGIAIACGTLAMAAIMIPANLIVTPLFRGAPVSYVISVMPFIIMFNLIKAGANGIMAFTLYSTLGKYFERFIGDRKIIKKP